MLTMCNYLKLTMYPSEFDDEVLFFVELRVFIGLFCPLLSPVDIPLLCPVEVVLDGGPAAPAEDAFVFDDFPLE